ncbi:MAG: ABC transporter ATP-binding protein/permease [Peptococcaceae bacterium]|nr:ABC transporter ATP-binding protein/permease [Peptococcaceae bacterium]
MIKRVWNEFTENKFYVLFIFSFLLQLMTYGYSLITAFFFSEEFTFARLIEFILILVVFYAAQSIFAGLLRVYSEKKARVYQRSLRRRSLVTILHLPSEKIIDKGMQLIKEIVSDANNQLYSIVSGYLTTVVNMIVGLIVLSVSLSRQSIWLCVLALGMIAITVLTHIRLLKKKVRLTKEYMTLHAGYRAMISDTQNNTLTIKKLGAEAYFAKKLDAAAQPVDAKGLENTVYDVRCKWLFDVFTYAILFLILGSIALELYRDPGYGTLFWVVFYTGIFAQLKGQISAVTQSIQSLVDFRISMQRYDDLMAECDSEEVALLHKKWRNLTVENLDFTYQSSGRSIHVETFYVERGDHISLTGPSGSGKSTFLLLLRGELESANGTISYNTSKRTRIVPYIEDCVFISQALNLFNDTLRNNLCLGQEHSDEKLYELLSRAGMEAWARSLPHKLDTMISENAANLSDGQKMRIKILRGIVCDREIYIMDEPSSNLDAESNERIMNLINDDLADKTVIISTHDPALVKICNKHYVTDEAGNLTLFVPTSDREWPLTLI